MHRPNFIISGGQTGADIGGLVGAKRVGIKTGGCSPRGFRTEKGSQETVLKEFGLVSHSSPNYKPRTVDNVRNSDATLICATDESSVGTRLTMILCKDANKPYLLVDPELIGSLDKVIAFIEQEKPTILNIAGNRESKSPGLAAKVAAMIHDVFES